LNSDEPKRKLDCAGRTIGVIGTLFSGVLAERFAEGVKHWAGALTDQNDSFSFGIAVIWALILSSTLAKFVGYVELFSSDFGKNTRTFLFVDWSDFGRRSIQAKLRVSYNHVRLNSAIGYITPKDMLAERQQEIQADWDRKLEAAERTPEESPPVGRVIDETDYFPVADHSSPNRCFGPSVHRYNPACGAESLCNAPTVTSWTTN
jgi:hypothetical protein